MAEAKITLVKGQAEAPLPPDEDLWDVARVARFLGFSRDTVYRLVEKGQIPFRRICARLRFLPAEIRAWASEGKV